MQRFLLGAAAAALICASSASAHEPGAIRADGHAPIGVMGDHTHKTGEWMISYRFMRMDMAGSRIGTDSVSPEEIVTTVANPNPGPALLRVAPTDMVMDMHMIGAMYAPNDRLTLMVMANYITKEMDHITFQGMAGITRLGEFTTRSEGFGDTRISALIDFPQEGPHRIHGQIGLSLPTGSIEETDDVLSPMNTRPTLRLPYSMQLGSGTVDPLLGLTYVYEGFDHWRFGAQASAILRVYDNDNDYRWGDEAAITGWASWSPAPAWSVSARAQARSQGDIEGRDPLIAAPVQTADPSNYGGDQVFAFAGVNWAGQEGFARGHRLAVEVGAPLYRDLNGPQLETDWTLTLGWQFTFNGG